MQRPRSLMRSRASSGPPQTPEVSMATGMKSIWGNKYSDLGIGIFISFFQFLPRQRHAAHAAPHDWDGLRWLEMPDSVRFKLCTLEYRRLLGLAPHYLSDLCTPATVRAHLGSSVTLERSLSIPRTKTKTIGPRGFYFASSAAWNALPVHLRDPELSLNSFKTELKTHFVSWPPSE